MLSLSFVRKYCFQIKKLHEYFYYLFAANNGSRFDQISPIASRTKHSLTGLKMSPPQQAYIYILTQKYKKKHSSPTSSKNIYETYSSLPNFSTRTALLGPII